MEARLASSLPVGPEWQYEPKWDGFRCLVFRDKQKVLLQSKSGQPLARYFPELVARFLALQAARFVLDGEILVKVAGKASFDHLLGRIHPAASRVHKLAVEFPASYVAFDLLVDLHGRLLTSLSLQDRRAQLERFAKQVLRGQQQVKLSPATVRIGTARGWFAKRTTDQDGIVAKLRASPYLSGSRDGMVKVKHRRTADCVVGGFRFGKDKRSLGSLLLGLYDQQGKLNHVGFTSSLKGHDRKLLEQLVRPLRGGGGFSGKAPGGPSRWNSGRAVEWEPLTPRLVLEVEYDSFTGDRFRHGTHFLRTRPDKSARACTYEQLRQRAEDRPVE